jgi:DNA repair protein RecN (Recombination protein N)
MLQKLYIQNYAIIDEIKIGFSENLNVITGETGAGKSILMGALSLILGERAEPAVLRDTNKKCVVEGHFATKNSLIKSFLADHELDAGEELILRREIAVNGKSRAFVNDTPVNLNQLKELSSLLVDLHQQFDTLELGDHNFQREILDALGDNNNLLIDFKRVFTDYVDKKNLLQVLKRQQQDANLTFDYNKFLFDELDNAGLKENELEDLDAELKLLSNAEEIKQQLNNIFFELKESEQPVVQQLKSLVNKLHSLQQFHTGIEDLENRLQSTQYEIADIADCIDGINDSVKYNPERLQVVNDRISLGYKLLKKHNVTTTAELLKIKEGLQTKLDDVLNIEESISANEKEVQHLLDQCSQMAEVISGNRHKAVKPLVEKVNTLLAKVGMPNAVIKIEVTPAAINQYGKDNIMFLFDANKSNRFEPLSKVASGGELSRIMLCIKSLVAQKLQLPVLIFDEIDTGISGEAARQVGAIMKELSAKHQVITITHQPQIAAKANAHYFVFKSDKSDQIATSIRLLTNEERVQTIAQMMAGENPTPAALKNAKEMMRV